MHNEWQSSSGYQVGDRITWPIKRHWLDIWWDRVRFMRWHVPAIEQRTFEAVSTSPGSIWPEVRD